MDIEEARRRLESAERALRGCEAHLQRALDDWRKAQASSGDNRLYYSLSRRHGPGYMDMFRKTKDAAMKQCKEAEEERDKARQEYEMAKREG